MTYTEKKKSYSHSFYVCYFNSLRWAVLGQCWPACPHNLWYVHPAYHLYVIKLNETYMDRPVTRPKRVNSPTWGLPPPWKRALRFFIDYIFIWDLFNKQKRVFASTEFQMIMIQYCSKPYITDWNCLDHAVCCSTEGNGGHGLKLQKLGPTFQVWMRCHAN